MEALSDILGQAILLAMLISALALIPSLILGLVISVFQAASQINEQTLSFLPKLLVVPLTLFLFRDFLFSRFSDFMQEIFMLLQEGLSRAT